MNNKYPIDNNQILFTSQGGFSIPLSNINIVIENYGFASYKLHTVEINNPDVCNIDMFTIRRKSFITDNYLDDIELQSITLNNVTFVDIDFYKFAYNLGANGDNLEKMDIRVLSTIDKTNIHKCEFRAFGEEN